MISQDMSNMNRVSPKGEQWRKSSYSTSTNCVEVADLGDTIAVRDSKDPDGPVLKFTRSEMDAWVDGCKAGEFDDMA